MKKYFINEAEFPIVISPSSNDLDLLAWAKTSQEDIRELLNKYGAILFRGFQVSNVNGFETFSSVASGGDWVEYREASTPRSKIQGNVFTSTSYDKNSIIFQHNENSHTTSWPLNIFFIVKLLQSQEEKHQLLIAEKFIMIYRKMLSWNLKTNIFYTLENLVMGWEYLGRRVLMYLIKMK